MTTTGSGLTHLFHSSTSQQWSMLFVAASGNCGSRRRPVAYCRCKAASGSRLMLVADRIWLSCVNKVMCACFDIGDVLSDISDDERTGTILVFGG